MSILELCLVFAALVMVLAPAYASEENALQIENLTSISPQVTDNIPRTPGFSSLLAGIMLIVSIFLIKGWNA